MSQACMETAIQRSRAGLRAARDSVPWEKMTSFRTAQNPLTPVIPNCTHFFLFLFCSLALPKHFVLPYHHVTVAVAS